MIREKLPFSFRKFSNIHIQGKDNILLFSTPRSGSTWLMEMIAGQPKMKTVREPLNVRFEHICEMLGLSSWDDIYKEENFPQIVDYLKLYFNNLKIDHRFKREKPFTDTWHLFTTRLVYKILHGLEDRIGELKYELDANIIVLIRNPIPVSLSRDVYPRLLVYQNSSYRKYFCKDELKFAQKITNSGSDFEKGILSWCFQNKVLLNQSKVGLLVSYEELVMNRNCVIPKITTHLKLPDPEKMLRRSMKASGSAGKSTKSRIQLLEQVQKGKTSHQKLIEKWKSNISPEMINKAQDILDLFKITAYRANEFMPCADLLICSASENSANQSTTSDE